MLHAHIYRDSLETSPGFIHGESLITENKFDHIYNNSCGRL